MKRFETVDEFIDSETQWKKELIALRRILNSTELEETVKWGGPVYTIQGKNVVGIGAFKSYFGIWFYQGVFLKDKKNKLINAQEGVTKALRQWRMNSTEEIDEKILLEYLKEAIQNQKAGKEVKPEKKTLVIPEDLTNALKRDTKLKKAFEQFTHSCKREFAEYVGEAKREETRLRRLEKVKSMILDKIGLNDKYK